MQRADFVQRVKCQECKREEDKEKKEKCFKERSDIITTYLLGLEKHQESLQFNDKAYILFYELYNQILPSIEREKYLVYKKIVEGIINKEYNYENLDKVIDSICRTFNSKHVDFINKYGSR